MSRGNATLALVIVFALIKPGSISAQSDATARGVPSHPTTLPSQSPLTPEHLFALASPAVVKLTIKDEDDREIGVASGFIVKFQKHEYDTKGRTTYDVTIVTNYHVIRPAIRIEVSFGEGKSGEVLDVVAEDESTDLAVLLANLNVKPKLALQLQDSAKVPVGTKVYVIGSPQGLSNTLSEGLISGYRKRGKQESWIQITAPISPGSSGGPLFSPEGWVIGVTTAFLRNSQNLNFAVPASEVSRLLALKEKSRELWEGASISKTQMSASLFAEFTCRFGFREANAKNKTNGQSEKTDEGLLEENVRAENQCALFIKGRELYRNKEYEEAIVMLRRATKAEPGEYTYLTNYALARAIRQSVFTDYKSKSDLEDAVEPLRRAKELNPNFGPTFYLLSNTFMWLGKYPEALVEAATLVRLMPRCYDGYQLRGQAWANLGRETAFERDFETACSLRPNDHVLLRVKAGGYVSLDKLQEAVDTYKDAIKLYDNYFPAYYGLGNALQRMGEYEEAIKNYQRVRKFHATAFGVEDRIAECRRQMMQSP